MPTTCYYLIRHSFTLCNSNEKPLRSETFSTEPSKFTAAQGHNLIKGLLSTITPYCTYLQRAAKKEEEKATMAIGCMENLSMLRIAISIEYSL